MLWMMFLPVLVFANEKIVTFENLKLRLIDEPKVCPAIKSLQRDKNMYWYAVGGWRSYNISFSKSLDRLVGVQWQGDKVGNVFCQYKDRSKLTFPVALQAPGLYLRPSWKLSKDKKVMHCASADLKECSFQQVKEVIKTYDSDQHLFELLESIKKGKEDG